MDVQITPTPPSSLSRADLRLLLAMAALVLALRGWQLTHTEVAARDSIGYIRIAWRLGHEQPAAVLRTSDQHPLFPATILAMSRLVRPFVPGNLPLAMQRSSQLVSALASLVLIVPMFLLGRELFDRRVAAFAVVLAQCLPASGRVMADGLSEPVFLVFATTALLLAAVGLRRGSPWALAGAGLAGGLAYLTRPEGGLIVAATALVLLAVCLVPRWRLGWKRSVACASALVLAALLVAGPYMAVIRGLSVKPTTREILHATRTSGPVSRVGMSGPVARSPARSRVLLAAFAPPDANYTRWGLGALGLAFLSGSLYVGCVPIVLGLWQRRRLFEDHPGSWVLLITALVLGFFLFKVATTVGYLSDRHALLILLLTDFWMAAGLTVLGGGVAGLVRRLRPAAARHLWGGEPCWSAALLLTLAAVPLVRTLAPLHGERAGLRRAGEWLAAHTLAGDYVDDPYCWSHYFAGRVFLEGRRDLPHHEPPVHYVVLEQSGNKHGRLHVRTEDQLRGEGGELVVRWPVARGREHVEIRVYAVPGRQPPWWAQRGS